MVLSLHVQPASSEQPNPLRGKILVGYHLDQMEVQAVESLLGRWFTKKAAPDEDEDPFAFRRGTDEWSEREPSTRIEHFRLSNNGWDNHDQEPTLAATVVGRGARMQRDEHVPFILLVLEFDLTVSRDPNAKNAEHHLVFVAQKCRDHADWLLDRRLAGRAEMLIVTSENWPLDELDNLRRDLQQVVAVDDDRFKKLLGSLPNVTQLPAGANSTWTGFSHYRIAINIHAVLGPITDSVLGGVGWLVTIYESDMGVAGATVGPDGILYVNPLGSSERSFLVEPRLTGFLFLLVLDKWIRLREEELRGLRKRMVQLEDRLRLAIIHPSALFVWGNLVRTTGQLRLLNHQLRTVAEEYRQDTIEQLERSEKYHLEIPIPPPGLRSAKDAERRENGPYRRLGLGFLKDLDRALSFAESTWAMAREQTTDYSVRIQRFVGIAVAILAAAQFASLLMP